MKTMARRLQAMEARHGDLSLSRFSDADLREMLDHTLDALGWPGRTRELVVAQDWSRLIRHMERDLCAA